MSKNSLLLNLVKLFETRKRQLYVAAISITKDRGAAEDAVQDALLTVSALKEEPDDLAAYLFRAVRNKALHSTKQSQRFTTETEFSEFVDYSSQSPEQQVLTSQIMKQLHTLKQDQQQVLIMKLFAGLTFEEISEITGCSINTVASWYRRGIAKLKENFSEHAL